MPFPFQLPTTSQVSFDSYIASLSHPSLPSVASVQRGIVREALKTHKRLSPVQQTSNLPSLLTIIEEYLPHVFTLEAVLQGRQIHGEDIDALLEHELQAQWRPTLSPSLPGKEPARVNVQSLEGEILFVLSAYAYTHSLLARSRLHTLFDAETPSPEQRTTAITTAMKHLLSAHSAHAYQQTRGLHSTAATTSSRATSIADIDASVTGALAALALAEATLITVLKDDPYPAAVAQDRNKHDKEWMYKAPTIKNVRAHLFARLCLAAADHAARAQTMLPGSKLNDALPRYIESLRRAARAKAFRFFGIDADLSGRTGEAIAWLQAASAELGTVSEESSSSATQTPKKLTKLKHSIHTRLEDRRIERGSANWGADAGTLEESRVVAFLVKKWTRENDAVACQRIPPFGPLLAQLPSGREYHTPTPFVVPLLEIRIIKGLRGVAAASDENALRGSMGRLGLDDGDSSEEEDGRPDPVGAFPGTGGNYAGGASTSAYY